MTHTSGITYAFLPDSPAVSAKYKELEVNFNPDIPGTNNVGADISTATMVERLAKAPLLCQVGWSMNRPSAVRAICDEQMRTV
eukprot:m.761618 g.761618  ORF g.761618 m.761618 type:complete len:83 (+) comp23205_c1_seq35:331-579(+)